VIELTCVLLTFVLTAVPFGQVIARYVADVDLQSSGSGNIGATNVARVVGKGPGLVTLVLDVSKGLLAVKAAMIVSDRPDLWGLVGLVAVLGHCFTPYLRWRGGKGVATSLGVLAGLVPWVAVGGLVVWLLGVGASRRSSVGALLALPVAVLLTGWWAPELTGWVVALALVVAMRHTSNIRRLLEGRELGVDELPTGGV
jgi:glycerol-3-phosphate acyltransferase PlsY